MIQMCKRARGGKCTMMMMVGGKKRKALGRRRRGKGRLPNAFTDGPRGRLEKTQPVKSLSPECCIYMHQFNIDTAITLF
jgi:hypothetical protein